MRGGVEKGKPVLGGSDISLYNPPGLSSYHTTDLLRVLCTFLGCKKKFTLREWALFRLTCAGARSPYLDEQDDDGQQVEEVSREPENVHLHSCFLLHTMTALCLKSHVFDDVHLCIRTTPPCFTGARPHPLTRRARGGHDIISLGKSSLVPSASGVWGRDFWGKLSH